jgi:hypothetical protein
LYESCLEEKVPVDVWRAARKWQKNRAAIQPSGFLILFMIGSVFSPMPCLEGYFPSL